MIIVSSFSILTSLYVRLRCCLIVHYIIPSYPGLDWEVAMFPQCLERFCVAVFIFLFIILNIQRDRSVSAIDLQLKASTSSLDIPFTTNSRTYLPATYPPILTMAPPKDAKSAVSSLCRLAILDLFFDIILRGR